MPRAKPSTFRIQSKKFFLTYPRCDLSKETVLEFLRTKGTLVDYVICIEDHKEHDENGGIGTHLHACVVYNRMLNITSERAFDIQEFHPNVQKTKNHSDARVYCMKDGNFIMNSKVAPFDYLNGHNFIKRKADYDAQTRALEQLTLVDPVWPILLHDRKTEWSPVGKQRGLWLVGDANTGKTTWFREQFDQRNYRYFSANQQPYPFEHYNGEQVLLFDDRDPTLDDIKNCINIHGRSHSVGKSRFQQFYWKYSGTEFYNVMIVLSNHVPVFVNDDAFKARFTVHFIQ